MELEKLRAKNVELEKQVKTLEAERDSLKTENEKKEIRIKDLVEVNGKLFMEISSQQKPSTKTVDDIEEDEEIIDLKNFDLHIEKLEKEMKL